MDGQINLAQMYFWGRGVPKDDRQTAAWYLRAAAQGSMIAQRALGAMYLNGWGVPQDDSKAVDWFTKAADHGDASSEFQVGYAYAFGRGVIKDEVAVTKWWSKCAQHNKDIDPGTRDQQSTVFKYFKTEAVAGDSVSQYFVGLMSELAIGVEPDTAAAIEWYRKAAAQGDAEAGRALQRLGK
jgi:hypothetical protein